MNYKLTLAYDGTNYHGWQFQKNAVSIEETLLAAMRKLMKNIDCLHGCSRTDAGVHALSFVCNFKVHTSIPPEKIPYALNSCLPEDIRVTGCEIVPEEFHARFDAKSKEYLYRIWNATFNHPIQSRYSYFVPQTLDLDAMKKAAISFLGEHDFRGFMLSGADVKTTVRTIYSLDLIKEEDVITIKICGNGFLHNMVRIIAGTLIYVGQGKIAVSDISGIIASCDRTKAGITAQPQGLFLASVDYEKRA